MPQQAKISQHEAASFVLPGEAKAAEPEASMKTAMTILFLISMNSRSRRKGLHDEWIGPSLR